jgi:hypothetical protein
VLFVSLWLFSIYSNTTFKPALHAFAFVKVFTHAKLLKVRERRMENVELSCSTEELDSQMAGLKAAAEAGNEDAFLVALRDVVWQDRPAQDYIRTTRFALQAGAHQAARRLSAEGAKRYPDNLELQKYARVLGQPKVISKSLPPDSTLKANRDWLLKNRNFYRGKWVAVRDGKLLGTAQSLSELIQQIGNTKDALLTMVY